ncbi:MAG: hypothetical protein ACXWB8_11975, partial [Ramlibacter sp.]
MRAYKLLAAACATITFAVLAPARAEPGAAHPASVEQDKPVQNIYGRAHLSLDGRWNYIVDPYENGYYNYRHQPFDATPSGKGGYYDDRKPADKSDWVEYDFSLA